jgi:hypothetical protein
MQSQYQTYIWFQELWMFYENGLAMAAYLDTKHINLNNI